jgi:hypothetical protein
MFKFFRFCCVLLVFLILFIIIDVGQKVDLLSSHDIMHLPCKVFPIFQSLLSDLMFDSSIYFLL